MSPISFSTIWFAVPGAIRRASISRPRRISIRSRPCRLLIEGSRLHLGAPIALVVVAIAAVLLGRTIKGFEIRVVGCRAQGGTLRRLQRQSAHDPDLRDLGRARRTGRHHRGRGPGRPSAAQYLARLRLHRHHRRVSGPAQSDRNIDRRPFPGADLHWRRAGADCDENPARSHQGVSGHPAVLRARLRLAHPLPHPPGTQPTARPPMGMAEAIILSVLAASTPLLLAAAGELVCRARGRAQSRRRRHDDHGRRLRLWPAPT